MTEYMARKHHPFTYFRDIERCPYIPNDPEYDDWNRKDDERLQKISKARDRIISIANQLMAHEDRDIRDLAKFTYYWFTDNEK